MRCHCALGAQNSPPIPGIGTSTAYFRDFKDTVYPFIESNTLFLEGVVCVVFSCSAILRIEGMSKQYPLTVFLESLITT